jgi:PAS domain S-box-containing protein
MNLQYSPYATLLFSAAAIAAVLTLYALRWREQIEAQVFGLAMLALFWWSLCYGLHMCGTNLETQYFFNRIKYIGVMLVSPLWLILAILYTRTSAPAASAPAQSSLLTRRNIILMFLPALVLLPIVLTDPSTHLWWPEIRTEEFNGYLVLTHTHGPFYYIHVIISYIFILLGLALYIRFHRRTALIYRSQALLLVIAAIIPLAASALTQIGLSPLPWGLDSFFFTISGVLLAIAIFRYRFLDITPVARQVLVEQIPEGVIVVDANGRIVDANPVAQALVSAKGKSIVGQKLAEAASTPDLKQALLEIAQPIAQQPPQPGGGQAKECDVHLSHGEKEQVLALRVTPLIHKNTHEIGQIILLQDISERIAAQKESERLYQQAKIERERLALTMSTASDAIVLLDAEGKILADNPAARQVLHTEKGGPFPPALQAVLDQARTVSRVIKAELEIGEQSFHVVASPIPGKGLVLTLHDVTHFRQLDRLKDEFFSTVAHDLRAPLTSIIGFAQMAQHPSTPAEKRRKALERIEAGAWRMSNLVTDMLDLATIEAGLEPRLEILDLDQLAGTIAKDFEKTIAAKGLTLQRELQPHSTVQADPRLMIQVWRNLVDNAIKYTSEGTITIRVLATGNRVTGQVSDSGRGISPADIPYVFGKFFRSKDPYSKGISGTGLGLSLVKSIIEQHGGQIWVDSELGVGSTFTFTLSRWTDQEELHAQAQDP